MKPAAMHVNVEIIADRIDVSHICTPIAFVVRCGKLLVAVSRIAILSLDSNSDSEKFIPALN